MKQSSCVKIALCCWVVVAFCLASSCSASVEVLIFPASDITGRFQFRVLDPGVAVRGAVGVPSGFGEARMTIAAGASLNLYATETSTGVTGAAVGYEFVDNMCYVYHLIGDGDGGFLLEDGPQFEKIDASSVSSAGQWWLFMKGFFFAGCACSLALMIKMFKQAAGPTGEI